MNLNVNFGSTQKTNSKENPQYSPSVYYYPTRPLKADEVRISNSQQHSRNQQYYPVQYPMQNKPFRLPSLQTVATVVGMGASIAIVGAFLGPQAVARFQQKHSEKIFTKMGDDIPSIDNLKSVNKNAKDFLQRIIDASKVSNEIWEYAGKPAGDRSILLYGPAGTGKSFFAKVAAKSMDADYTEIDFSQIASPYVGQASKNIRDKANAIISKAQKAPNVKHVITFNEIDSLIMKDPDGKTHSAEVRSTMLNILEQLQELPNVLIVGTTNKSPKGTDLDKASIDRFHTIFEIPLPDKKCLFEAIKSKLEKVPAAKDFLQNNQKDINRISESLEKTGFSHRKLAQLIEKAKNMYMIDKNKSKDTKFDIDYLNKAFATQVEGLSKYV